MSIVGNFPGLGSFRRQAIRAPVNLLDKSTVVSIYPKRIHEEKITLQPGIFDIEAGSYENPAILVVGTSSWWKELEPDQPMLEIPVGSIQIADSIVRDYCNGYLASNMGDTMPGLFYLPGEWTVEKVKKEKKVELDQALAKQKKWYELLVRMGDTLWARTNGNPVAISEDMRLAAKELNLNDNKEWTKDAVTLDLVRCKACGSLKNPNFPICSNCKAIDDPEKAAKLGLVFAK